MPHDDKKEQVLRSSSRWIRPALLLLALLTPLTTFAGDVTPPPVMLANVYHDKVNLADYLVSEKLDGVRGYWDGKQLLTRGGEFIAAPAWFTAGWPNFPLDGELWVERDQFSTAVSIVRTQSPDDAAWRTLNFMVFDLPEHPGNFAQRNAALNALLTQITQPWLRQVEQFKIANQRELHALLKQVVQCKGEGLMLHRASSFYQAGRSDDLLKLKPYLDAEAKVIRHLLGKGKYQGLLGALLVETPAGLRFKIGSGFSDVQRQQPPALGSWISYRYIGFNKDSGIPRFASFIRVREDRQP